MYRHVGQQQWEYVESKWQIISNQWARRERRGPRSTLANAKRRENARARKTETERMHSASGHFENTRNALSFGVLSLVQHLGDSKQPPRRDATCVSRHRLVTRIAFAMSMDEQIDQTRHDSIRTRVQFSHLIDGFDTIAYLDKSYRFHNIWFVTIKVISGTRSVFYNISRDTDFKIIRTRRFSCIRALKSRSDPCISAYPRITR